LLILPNVLIFCKIGKSILSFRTSLMAISVWNRNKQVVQKSRHAHGSFSTFLYRISQTLNNEELTMRTLSISALSVVAFVLMNCGVIRADLRTPEQIVGNFNSLGPNGWECVVTLTPDRTSERIIIRARNDSSVILDLSAYTAYTSTEDGFYTIRVSLFSDSGIDTGSGTATLNYDGNSTRLAIPLTNNAPLPVGAAYLYMMYATGQFDTGMFDYYDSAQRLLDSSTLTGTFHYLTVGGSASWDWETNKFLKHLLDINGDQTYWTDAYNPNQRYDEIGDYAVFVVNIVDNANGQYKSDRLYVVGADYSSGNNGVPEPATLLLWTLGGIGVMGTNSYRKRSKKA
jgi:hypothetical protein